MITSATQWIFGLPSPVLRIPFRGVAGTSGVRTTWEEDRGRSAAEGSIAEA
jgi:hypothetical protein